MKREFSVDSDAGASVEEELKFLDDLANYQRPPLECGTQPIPSHEAQQEYREYLKELGAYITRAQIQMKKLPL